jgi:enterochelin esterase-like enzyme
MANGDNESDEKQNQMNLTESEQAIMDMLKRSNLDGVNQTSNRTSHAFWDTQVRSSGRMIVWFSVRKLPLFTTDFNPNN